MVADTAIKSQIRKLVDLQKIDGEIYNLNKDLQGNPQVIKALAEEFENNKQKLKELEDKFKAVLLKRKDKELDLKTKEEGIAKTNAQLSFLKTNKEYSAKLQEIESLKADKSIVEEQILISYDESDKLTAEIEKEKKVIAQVEQSFPAKKRLVEDEMNQLEGRVKILETQRKEILPGIDSNFLSRYEKILQHKDGLAIVPIQGTTCGGCFMNVTTQMINTIKLSDGLIFCEMCTRILYLEDNL